MSAKKVIKNINENGSISVVLDLLARDSNSGVEIFLPLLRQSDDLDVASRYDPFGHIHLSNSTTMSLLSGSVIGTSKTGTLLFDVFRSESGDQTVDFLDLWRAAEGFQLRGQDGVNARGLISTKLKTPDVNLLELADALRSERAGPYKSDAIGFAWYGGALFLMDTESGRLTKDVCSYRPDIAAKQIEYDMHERIGAILRETHEGTSNIILKRNRMRV